MSKLSKTVATALAKLRPGVPLATLRMAVDGHAAFAPNDERECGDYKIGFVARLDDDGWIERVAFFVSFPSSVSCEGLTVGMSSANAMAAQPTFQIDRLEVEAADDKAFNALVTTLADGCVLSARFFDDKLVGFDMTAPGVKEREAAADAASWRLDFPPMKDAKAYDLRMLPRWVDRKNAADNHGWVFGLPPGIQPNQWPLDPVTGYPLMHGFTLKLPPEYRVHGPAIVALSFFATASDQNDGGADGAAALAKAVLGRGKKAPTDAELRALWERERERRHPQLHRMDDILGYAYAVILLTQAEFDGPLCQPPTVMTNAHVKKSARPMWLDQGAGAAYVSELYDPKRKHDKVDPRYRIDWFDGPPTTTLEWHRAIACTPRAADPNAGVQPQEPLGRSVTASGYQRYYDWDDALEPPDNFKEKAWAKSHFSNHIGGTMRPAQGYPAFTPYVIGFEEYFGGYNFGGGGNAQLDFFLMKFDWACG